MAQENVFGHLMTPSPQPPQPVQNQDPIIKPRDPYKDAAEARAQQDQALQQAAAAREAERLRLAQQGEQRQATKDAEGTSDERTAGFLTGRIKDAVGRLSGAGMQNKDALSPSIGVEAVRNVAGNAAANYLTDADRQVVRAAQLDILDAALTLGTGAAYNKEQLESYRESYFPQLGDDPKAVASKNEALRTLLVNARVKAGRAAPDIDAALASLDALNKAPVDGGSSPEDAKKASIALWGGEYYDDKGNPLGPDGGAAFDAQGNSVGLFGSVTDTSGAPPVDGPPDPRDPNGMSGLGALAKQGVTLGLSDEAAGIGGYLSGFLTGEDPSKAYARERDTERAFIDKARKEWGGLGIGAELMGGGGAARVTSNALTLGSVARQGAGLGGIGGFGYGEGDQSIPNALLGAAGGAVLGAGLYGAGAGVNALANRRPPRQPMDLSVVEAGQRQNIPIRQPDARPELRGQYASAESGQTSGPLIREARTADNAAMESRVTEIGGKGAASDPYALGTKVQGAGERYIAKSRQQANRLYERASKEAGGATVTARNADAALDRHITELKAAGENSNAGAIKYLEGLRDDIDRGLTIEAAQSIRSNMRGQISERGLTGTDTERRVGDVVKAMTQDLTEQLPPNASSALRAADKFYAEKQDFINSVLKQVMGSRGAPLPAETAAQRVVSMAQGKGNYERFSRLWGQLDPAEQADTAATVAASLGRNNKGDFSPAILIKNLDPKQGINPRTAQMIFGKDGAAALADLRTIAAAKVEAMGRQSPSGQAIGAAKGGLRGMLLAAFGFSQGDVTGAVVAPMAGKFLSNWGEQRAARMLLNPDFTKWMKNAPNTSNPRAIDAYFSKLAGIGSIAANDNQAFTAALMNAVRKSPGSAAAEQSGDSGREPPPNQGP